MEILRFSPIDLYDLSGGGGANEVLKSARKTVVILWEVKIHMIFLQKWSGNILREH